MWSQPVQVDNQLLDMSRQLDCDWVGAVHVQSHSAYDVNQCHTNIRIQTSLYGGETIIGYYFVMGFGTIQAIRHTVWLDPHGNLVDVTPYLDGREYIIFARSKSQELDYSIPNCFYSADGSYEKYKQGKNDNRIFKEQLSTLHTDC
jgi:hypothetical protein